MSIWNPTSPIPTPPVIANMSNMLSVLNIAALQYVDFTQYNFVYIEGNTTFADKGAGHLYAWIPTDTTSANTGNFIVQSLLPGGNLSGRWYLLKDTVHPSDFGAVVDGVTDDHLAVQACGNYCGAIGATLLWDRGTTAMSGVSFTAPFSIKGFSKKDCKLTGLQSTGPLIAMDRTNVTWFDCEIADFTANYIQTPNTNTSLLGLVGNPPSNATYWQYNSVHGIVCAGFAAFWADSSSPQSQSGGTVFAGCAAWNDFYDIKIVGFGANIPNYGWYFGFGSGTGNLFSGIVTALATNSHVFWYGSTGCVVGDILVSNSSFGASSGGASYVIGIGDNTIYRQKIRFDNCQYDAGVSYPYDLSAVGTTEYVDIVFNNCNVGGGTTFKGLKTLQNAKTDDLMVSNRRAGVTFAGTATGAQTIALFSVALDQFTGSRISIDVMGLVGGVAACMSHAEYLVLNSGTVAAPSIAATTVNSTTNPSSVPSGGFVQSSSISGNVITFKVTFNPTSAAGSNFDAQISCVGGKINLYRGS